MPSNSDKTSELNEQDDAVFFDGQAAALRDATEAGSLFHDAFRSEESQTDSGHIAGSTNDPVLIAGVGYPLLGDLALGTVVAYHVADWELPDVAVADCSHTPIAAYQTLTGGTHQTVILIGAEKRGGELNDGIPSATPGAIHETVAADYEIPADDELAARIGESAMGSNTIENVLVISKSLGELPDDTRVITVEPGYDSWGMNVDEFTDPVDDALDEVLDRTLDYIDRALMA
jgi:Ni,Fe-hydrogenase maturation factor